MAEARCARGMATPLLMPPGTEGFLKSISKEKKCLCLQTVRSAGAQRAQCLVLVSEFSQSSLGISSPAGTDQLANANTC